MQPNDLDMATEKNFAYAFALIFLLFKTLSQHDN